MEKNINVKNLWADSKGTVTIFGVISTLVGFVSDVLQPLAPFATYISIIALPLGIILILTSIYLTIRRPALENLVSQLRLIALAALLVGGVNLVFVALQSDSDRKEEGLLASNFEWIQSIQKSLGVIKQDLADIKGTTGRIEESTKNIEMQGGRIEAKLDSVANSFEGMAKAGGLIINPESATEWYYNSRVYQDQGDFGKARHAFNKYFELADLPYYDPALTFKNFLITMEGRIGAAESLRETLAGIKNLPLDIMLAELQEPNDAVLILEELADKNKKYGPLNYALANQFTAVRRGIETLETQQSERKYLKKFLAAHEEGNVLKYFIDQRMVEKWLTDSEARLAKNSMLDNISYENTLQLSPSRSNSSWIISISMTEPAIKFLFRYKKDSPLEDTGSIDTIDMRTGKPMPNYYFQLSPSADLSKLEVYYIDASGKEHGPYRLPDEIASNEKATAYAAKKTLNTTRHSWISFRDFNGSSLVYFTHLISRNCAIKELRYSIGTNKLDKLLDLGKCDIKNPNSVPGDATQFIKLDDLDSSVYVQLVYYDDSISPIELFTK